MFIVNNRKIWFAFSLILIAGALYAMFTFGFNLSIDFKGGTITEVSFPQGRPDKTMLEESLGKLDLGGFSVRPADVDKYIVRTRELSQTEASSLVEAMGNPTVERQNTVGPVAGADLKSKAVKAVLVVLIMIVLFVTFAFRKVSRPVSSWKYGLATILALAHDVIIPVGVFVLLGKLYGFEIDLLFVSGLLAILGYSVHDTIVVFDRIRENLRTNQDRNQKEEFEATVGKSVTQTMSRSINTSLTIFIVLMALYLVGSTATKDFALLLIIGVIAGTYSSIFLASPLLVTFFKLQKGSK